MVIERPGEDGIELERELDDAERLRLLRVPVVSVLELGQDGLNNLTGAKCVVSRHRSSRERERLEVLEEPLDGVVTRLGPIEEVEVLAVGGRRTKRQRR